MTRRGNHSASEQSLGAISRLERSVIVSTRIMYGRLRNRQRANTRDAIGGERDYVVAPATDSTTGAVKTTVAP